MPQLLLTFFVLPSRMKGGIDAESNKETGTLANCSAEPKELGGVLLVHWPTPRMGYAAFLFAVVGPSRASG